jgi:hypothetical protein
MCVQEPAAEQYVLSEVEEVLEAGEICITKSLWDGRSWFWV